MPLEVLVRLLLILHVVFLEGAVVAVVDVAAVVAVAAAVVEVSHEFT